MSRLDSLVEQHPLATLRPFAWGVVAALTLAIIWAGFAKLDEVAVAQGEVSPQGKIKVIQHLEGGIVEALFVREGDAVTVGAPLVQLDLATSGVNRQELQARMDGHILARARLEAEAQGLDEPAFPPEIAERRPGMLGAERRAFEARREEMESTLRVLAERITQRELEVNELKARQRAVTKNLALARERLAMSSSLLEEGLTAKMEHLELKAEVEDLEGESQRLLPSIPRAEAAVAEAREQLQEERSSFRRSAREELSKEEQIIASIRELTVQATDQGMRAEIKSPINGVVKNMSHNTIGGVVRPGEPILEIVPTGEALVIEAKLKPEDRGYVEEGQAATVKISTYDFIRYGSLAGTVNQVAPDSSIDEKTGETYFRVIVKTDKDYLGDEVGRLPITPGMQATVDIKTGQKSVMEYLLVPVLKLRHDAFRER